MGRTKSRFAWVAGIAVVAVLVPAVAVAEAPPSTGTINAVDIAWENPATGQSKVVIAPGGTVNFSYPSGGTIHNVVFNGASPTSCTQTAGPNSGPAPPLPATPSGPGWAGTCNFDAEGTFAFVCGFHAGMNGSVVVSSTIPAEPPSGGGGGSGGGAADTGGPAASKLVVAAVQRGGAVRGSVVVAGAGSRLGVDLLARRSALGGSGAKLVSVGRISKAVGAGKRVFSVALSGAAKRTVADAGRFAVTVKVKVTPARGAAFAATKAVVVKPAG
jgi:plastocyanin